MLIKVSQVSLPSLPSPKVAAPRRSPSPLILRIPSEIKTRLQSLLRPRGIDERRERAGKTATSPAHPSLRRPLLVAAAATTVSPLPLRCARRRPPPLAPAARACTVALRGGSASRAAAAIGRERQRRRRPPPPPRRRARCILKGTTRHASLVPLSETEVPEEPYPVAGYRRCFFQFLIAHSKLDVSIWIRVTQVRYFVGLCQLERPDIKDFRIKVLGVLDIQYICLLITGGAVILMF
ncbi:hypothetical protein GWI33_021141 [Rhynchophorus ferrugineus]|uniref:Uncharacterized protein n=1 Tax=Rhynchophorus ferrugineus TaxID=354439 RepID=A0A834HND7_RHYFE|nr:hypothetical protein GWI33_021141 [Rhynchophorus ferrugineus]